MEDDKAFLKFFIEEDLYLIPEDQADIAAGDEDATPEIEGAELPITFEGEHRQQVTCLIGENDKRLRDLGEEERAFLLKVLDAVNLKLIDVAIVQLSQNPDMDFFQLQKQLAPQRMLIFGAPPESIGIDIPVPSYESFPINGVDIINAEELSAIMTNKQKKMALWNCLKGEFL